MNPRRDARGDVAVLLTAVVVVAVLLCGAMAHLGSAVVQRSRAGNAADAAALAAAGVLALGLLPGDACAAARRTSAENGAALLTCLCAGPAGEFTNAEVTIEMNGARARARAEIDARNRPRGGRGAPNAPIARKERMLG